MSALGLALTIAVWCCGAPPGEVTTAPTTGEVRESIRLGIDFLLRNQEADGSWGSLRNAAVGIDEMWTNPETHRSWTVAVTGLVCMALSEAGAGDAVRTAYEKGVDYLLANALVKRPNEWDVDNTWGYVYGLQSLVDAYRRAPTEAVQRRARIREVGQAVIGELSESQTPDGGWGYYDFEAYTHPGSWATSFMTAVGVLSLVDARDAGFTVDAKRLETAVRAVRRCRLPNGAYTYSVDAIGTTGSAVGINQLKGSLGRIQVCNLALLRAGEAISRDDLAVGLGHFFRDHRFLDIAFQKPIPHEAYYYNSGYFYFFGHYYAGLVIEALPTEERAGFWKQLQHEIIKTQEEDGSMWDYYMNSYHRPYGAAYSVLTLSRSLGPESHPPAP